MEIKDRYLVKCESINYYGKGVCKIDSLLVFVDNIYPSEEAIIEITKKEKNYSFGKVIELTKKSPYRIEDECNHSHDSGTCPFNNISIDEENRIKSNIVKNLIERNTKVTINKDIEVLMGNKTKGYRNKVTVFFKEINNEYKFGYFKEGSREFIEVTDCVQIDVEINSIINNLLYILKTHNIPLFDHKNNRGVVKGVSIRKSEYNSSISVMILSSLYDDEFKLIANELKDTNKNITGVSLIVNKNKDTVVYSGKEYILYGNDFIYEKILDKIFKVNNRSFLQVSTSGASLLYKKAIDYLEPKDSDNVIDLYSGCGGISLNLAKYVNKVYGVEIVEDAVKLANYNKKYNNVSNALFYESDSKNFKTLLPYKTINKLIVDPPRAGLSKDVINDIISIKPEIIVYVSCDPYTLSRDLKEFISNGYELKDISCVNMFLRTIHVESVCLLVKKDSK